MCQRHSRAFSKFWFYCAARNGDKGHYVHVHPSLNLTDKERAAVPLYVTCAVGENKVGQVNSGQKETKDRVFGTVSTA